MNKAKLVEKILTKADIQIGGSSPQDVQIHNDRLYSDAFRGTLGFGESYMRGDWDSNDLEETVYHFYASRIEEVFKPNLITLYSILKAHLFNPQIPVKSVEQIRSHFDRDTSMYQKMLGSTMSYTCAYWTDPAMSLDAAQEAKLNLICQKLHLNENDHVLDIGCGWGSFAFYAAQNYGCRVTGVTISKKQFEYCEENKALGNNRTKIILADYRNPKLYNPEGIKYDKVTAIGVMEHLGLTNLTTFFETAYNQLKDGGLFLLHTIGSNYRKLNSDKWIEKYIFPGGELASLDRISLAATDHCKFNLEHFENFGPYYATTLRAWFQNFDQYWKSSANTTNDEHSHSFYRMWKFYLLSCAGAFRAKRQNLWHFLLSKNYPDVYTFNHSPSQHSLRENVSLI